MDIVSTANTQQKPGGFIGTTPQGQQMLGSFRRRRSKIRPKSLSKGVAKSVAKIAKAVYDNESNKSPYVYVSTDFNHQTTPENSASYKIFYVGRKDSIDTVLQSVDMYTRVTSTLGTDTTIIQETENLITLAATFDTLFIPVLDHSMFVQYKNNSISGVKVHMYWCICKTDTEKNANESIVAGLADRASGQTVGGAGQPASVDVHPSLFPGHSKLFREDWTILSTETMNLDPGADFHFKIRTGEFDYYPEYFVQNPNIDCIAGLTRCVIVRVVGQLAHDATTSTNVGLADNQLDYKADETYKIGTVDLNFNFDQVKFSDDWTDIDAVQVHEQGDMALDNPA